jgi:hypothetical protein
MKIKLFMMILFVVLLNSNTASTRTGANGQIYAENENTFQKDSTSIYSDSLSHYILDLKIKTDSIYKNKKEIENNKIYYQEIINEKQEEKIKIKKLIKSVDSTIQAKLELKNRIFYKDSVCVKSTGFIRRVFAKDSCREWKVKEFYYNKDSIKIYK